MTMAAPAVPVPLPGRIPAGDEAYQRAVDSHDPRFDGVFYVAITTTRIYCRPVCPSRNAAHDHRRFFASAAAAERAGYRPCLRCRPELAPGRAVANVLSRLASAAVQRIAAGALNGRSVADLARELGVGERHLRRALEREMGVAPLALAQTHRLLLAKRLLADTELPVTRVAYASGFQSLRRFNAAFREQYGLPPSTLRRGRARRPAPGSRLSAPVLRLALAYRSPFAWGQLLDTLRRTATPGLAAVHDCRYGRTVHINGHTGVVWAEDAITDRHLAVEVSESLLPVLMPLIAGLRRLFDLDAEPAVVNAHLEQGGLGELVARHPGLRIPGALDGFEVALHALLGTRVGRRVAAGLGTPLLPALAGRGLTHVAPTAAQVAKAGAAGLIALGAAPPQASCVAALAGAVAAGGLRLEPGSDVVAVRRALLAIDGVSEEAASVIEMRALAWPDAFPITDPAVVARAEQWRPWRAYAALHLWLDQERPRR